MEPPRSPETSPVKSSCPSSPIQSPPSSIVVSPESSPIRSEPPSSPIHSNPSSPYNEVPTSCDEVSQQSDFFQQHKRQKLCSMETEKLWATGPNNPDSFHQEGEDHCHQVFTDNLDKCNTITREDTQFGDETNNQDTGADTFAEQGECFAEQDCFAADADNQTQCKAGSRERKSSCSSSCDSSSSSSSSEESYVSNSSSDGRESSDKEDSEYTVKNIMKFKS